MNFAYGQRWIISRFAVDRPSIVHVWDGRTINSATRAPVINNGIREIANMSDILHKIGIKSSSLDDAYKALATVEGLSRWWTSDTRGQCKVGGVLQFRFGAGGFDMKVLELQPAKHVLWQVIDGPEEWLGTTVMFDLKKNDDWTIVLFKHTGWKEPVEFMHHCSTSGLSSY